MILEGFLKGLAMLIFVTAIAYALGCVSYLSFSFADWSEEGRKNIASLWAFASFVLTAMTIVGASEGRL